MSHLSVGVTDAKQDRYSGATSEASRGSVVRTGTQAAGGSVESRRPCHRIRDMLKQCPQILLVQDPCDQRDLQATGGWHMLIATAQKATPFSVHLWVLQEREWASLTVYGSMRNDRHRLLRDGTIDSEKLVDTPQAAWRQCKRAGQTGRMMADLRYTYHVCSPKAQPVRNSGTASSHTITFISVCVGNLCLSFAVSLVVLWSHDTTAVCSLAHPSPPCSPRHETGWSAHRQLAMGPEG